jgi:hypothetical protein
MAELNFGLLTPPGSQSIGNAFVQGMDQAAVARAQENQNALAQYTLGKAKREDEQQNKLYQAVQDPNFKLDVRTALQYGPQGMAALKAQQDAATAEQTRALNQSQIAERQARLPGYVAEAFDKQMKPFSSAAYNSKNVGEGIASINAMYDNPALASVLTKIKSREQAIESTTAAFNDPKTMAQWQAYWGGITPDKLYTQATVSANTAATLDQAQQHFNGLSAYQKEQLRVQGKQFDSDRGVIVDVKNGTFEPVYSYPSSTPSAPAAPAAIPTAPSAAPASALPPQLNVTPGIAPSSASNVPIPQSIVGARVPPALQNVRDNDRLAILLKERENQVFLGRVDPALDREIANLQGKPTNVASQTTTQPAQRTVLGPKTETPRFDTNAGGFVYPPSAENPQGKFVPVSGLDGKPLNESQGNATAYGLRMKEAEAILADLANPKIGDATLRGANVESIPFVGGAVGKVLPSFLGGSSEQQQQVNQAKTNFITAVLRKESGAAIGKDEFATEDRKYFPQLNDGPKVIKQKEDARRLAIEAMKFQAGPGAKEIDKYVPSISREKTAPNLSEPPAGAVRVKAK